MNKRKSKYSEIQWLKFNRLKSFLIYIHGRDFGLKRYYQIMRSSSLKTLIFKYGEEEGKERYKKIQKINKIKLTLPHFIEKYGEEEGTKRYYDKNSRVSVGVESLKKRGFSEKEILEIKTRHSKGSKTDQISMIEKYGEEEGKERYKKRQENKFSSRRVEDVMKKFDLSFEEATRIVSNNQRRDLNFFIQKYGEEEGNNRFILQNLKKSYANTEEYYIEKYGEESGKIKYKEFRKKQSENAKLVSNVSYYIEKYGEEEGLLKFRHMMKQKVSTSCNSIIQSNFAQFVFDILQDDLKKYFYGFPINKGFIIPYISNEFGIKAMCPDIRIKNLIIEFDGEYWHSRQEIKFRDVHKDILFDKLGFKVLRIQEIEYRENNLKIVQRVINFIKEFIDINYSFSRKLKELDEDKID